MPIRPFVIAALVVASARHVLDGLAKVVLLPAVLVLGLLPVSAGASVAAQPVIAIGVVDAATAGLNGAQVFAWEGRRLMFGAQVQRHDITTPLDVYFGVLTPSGRVLTWRPAAGEPILQDGFFPAVQANTTTDINVGALLGKNPEYEFPAGHELGVYSIFCIVLPAGVDPRSVRSWQSANMSPVVVSY